ncbi:hypothetical protein STHE1630_00180, partial [Streptococcus thermophilus CNCM I-1630]
MEPFFLYSKVNSTQAKKNHKGLGYKCTGCDAQDTKVRTYKARRKDGDLVANANAFLTRVPRPTSLCTGASRTAPMPLSTTRWRMGLRRIVGKSYSKKTQRVGGAMVGFVTVPYTHVQ